MEKFYIRIYIFLELFAKYNISQQNDSGYVFKNTNAGSGEVVL